MTMGFGGLFGLVLIGIVVWLVWNRNRSTNPSMSDGNGSSAHEEGALEILKKRYARGEISQLEYDRMEQDLKRP